MNAKVNTVEYYLNHLEEKYTPSTFKYVKVGGLFSNLFELFESFDKESKDVHLYMNSDDRKIDEKEIENDLAVVAKDFITAFNAYGRITKN